MDARQKWGGGEGATTPPPPFGAAGAFFSNLQITGKDIVLYFACFQVVIIPMELVQRMLRCFRSEKKYIYEMEEEKENDLRLPEQIV